ncbi:MAG: hypothetical protein IGS03_17295 [Candidatus Sericytochromatia bacterium]|nr:hypothetical protein [Candidatus Sericytochromatia bacterium]
MHIKRVFAGISLAAALTACGLYTNIPAQIRLDAPSQGVTATVTYTVSQEQIQAEVQNPTIALVGEPGSIGVTYDEIAIEYLPESLGLNPRTMRIAGTIRVPSSHQFDADQNVLVGRAETEIPVVSSHVVQLGNPLNQGRVNSQISARVTLSGTDDAGFRSSYEFYVPINFLSSALPTS